MLDASPDFIAAKNQNNLGVEHRQQISDTVTGRKKIEKYAYLASLKEIADNDFNPSIPGYVDTIEEEAEIDVAAVEEEIEQFESELAAVRAQMKKYLKEFGV